MCHPLPPLRELPCSATGRAEPCGLPAAVALVMLCTLACPWAAQAEAMGDLYLAQLDWRHKVDEDNSGKGLGVRGHALWPHWEGRIGIMVDRPLDPLKNNFVFAQPLSSGFKVRSMHLLSDYNLGSGLRATVGLVRGETSRPWWSGDNGSGLNLSLQHLDSLGMLPRSPSDLAPQRTSTYIGAGYSTQLTTQGSLSVWRFNADVGLLGGASPSNIGRVNQVIQGSMGLDELVHDMSLRPMVKVSVDYAF